LAAFADQASLWPLIPPAILGKGKSGLMFKYLSQIAFDRSNANSLVKILEKMIASR
jgi:hypothetical protein